MLTINNAARHRSNVVGIFILGNISFRIWHKSTIYFNIYKFCYFNAVICGFFGKGIGEGTLKTRVPEAHTDYIVSVISEEFGVVAIILILILFLFFIYSVFKKIYLEKSEKIKLVLTGAISLIIFQALIHLGVNIRLFPTTGITLPFLSYGGSSIVGVSILSGIILNLTKRKMN